MTLDGYEAGIAYSTGYIAQENNQSFLVVRNIDKFYCDGKSANIQNTMFTT